MTLCKEYHLKLLRKTKLIIYIYKGDRKKYGNNIYIYKGDRKKNGNNKSFKIDINIASP